MPKLDGCVQIMEGCSRITGGDENERGVDVSVYLEAEAMASLLEDKGLLLERQVLKSAS